MLVSYNKENKHSINEIKQKVATPKSETIIYYNLQILKPQYGSFLIILKR